MRFSRSGGTPSVTIPAAAVSGTDTAPGTIASLTLTALPTNATSITVNGVTYTAAGGSGTTAFPAGGIPVPTATNGNPTQTISVDPANGAVTVAIPFTVTDNQGGVSANTASVSVPFSDLTISGTVLNEPTGIVGDGTFTGAATGTPGGTQVYVNLVSAATNKVLAVATVDGPSGTYSFGTASGVASGAKVNFMMGAACTRMQFRRSGCA